MSGEFACIEIDENNVEHYMIYNFYRIQYYDKTTIQKCIDYVANNKLEDEFANALKSLWKMDTDKIVQIIDLLVENNLMHIFAEIISSELIISRIWFIAGKNQIRDTLFSHLYSKMVRIFPEKKEKFDIIVNGILKCNNKLNIIDKICESAYRSRNDGYYQFLDNLKEKART